MYYISSDLPVLGSSDSFRYISHHGVLGQKWGVRRYQNKDGTRTSLGKKHEQQSQYVANGLKAIKQDRDELKKLGWTEYNKTSHDRFVKTDRAIQDIIDYDPYISKRIEKAQNLASKLDDENLPDEEIRKVSEQVNALISECENRYGALLTKSGMSESDVKSQLWLDDESFWLRIDHFGR